jgi:thymidylate synthase
MRPTTINDAYRGLLTELYHRGLHEMNARTGVGITMLPGGHSFKLDLSEGLLPAPGNRRYFPHVAAVETAWQFLGTQDPGFVLDRAPKLWSNFVEDGRIKTAYGYRWRRHFGRDQLALAMAQLVHEPTNRQLYISAWDPARDGLGGVQPKNIPCPVGFSLTRTGHDLHCSLFIRSSDVFVGLPYDVMGYALTVDAIAASCELKPGTLHVTLAHPHYYDPHAQMVEDCVHADCCGTQREWMVNVRPSLPGWTVGMILKDPGAYVEHVRRLASRVPRHEWSPLPELVV